MDLHPPGSLQYSNWFFMGSKFYGWHLGWHQGTPNQQHNSVVVVAGPPGMVHLKAGAGGDVVKSRDSLEVMFSLRILLLTFGSIDIDAITVNVYLDTLVG